MDLLPSLILPWNISPWKWLSIEINRHKQINKLIYIYLCSKFITCAAWKYVNLANQSALISKTGNNKTTPSNCNFAKTEFLIAIGVLSFVKWTKWWIARAITSKIQPVSSKKNSFTPHRRQKPSIVHALSGLRWHLELL